MQSKCVERERREEVLREQGCRAVALSKKKEESREQVCREVAKSKKNREEELRNEDA